MMSLKHRSTTVAAVALVTAALSASAASARPIDAGGPDAATRPASAPGDPGGQGANDRGAAGARRRSAIG